MKLTETIACTAAFLLTPALASAAPAHDHAATGQSQPAQGETARPEDMKCPMVHGMHGGMKMDGHAMPPDQGSAQHPSGSDGSMKGMDRMKCVQSDAAPTPPPASAAEEQHKHDHSGAATPQ